MSNPYEPLQVRGADPSPKRKRGVLHRSLALPARIRVGGLWPIGVIAALLCGLWQAPLRRLRRQLVDRPFATLASALTIGLFLHELAPFDFVTDTAGLHASFGRARWDLTSALPLAFGDPAFALMAKQLTGAAWFAALGYLFALAGRRSGRHSATATALAVRDGFVLACLVEFMQLFIRTGL